MEANRRADTAPELRLRSTLHARGLRFRKDLRFVVDGVPVRPDVVFTRACVAVFVDGCFWHRCPLHAQAPKANGEWWRHKLDLNVARDRRDDAALVAAGWAVIRVWEHDAVADAAERIESAVRARENNAGGRQTSKRLDDRGSSTLDGPSTRETSRAKHGWWAVE